MSKQTIREVLEDVYSDADAIHEQATLELAERVEAVLRLHRPVRELIGLAPSADERCAVCKDTPWPCLTLRALNGEESR